jgi:hypothetical protein
MNKKIEWLIIIFLVVILVGLSGCTEKEVSVTKNPKLPDTVVSNSEDKQSDEPVQEPNTVQNIPGIVKALTCMFSDQCERTKQERNSER